MTDLSGTREELLARDAEIGTQLVSLAAERDAINGELSNRHYDAQSPETKALVADDKRRLEEDNQRLADDLAKRIAADPAAYGEPVNG